MEITGDSFYLSVKDHAVSGETFDLYYNDFYDLVFTEPQPEIGNLHKYYESDNYISHTDSKKSLLDKAYHLVKEIALKNKISLINTLQPRPGLLLDIGAGTGDFVAAAIHANWNAIGVEPSSKARAAAITKGLDFMECSAKIASHSCDVITMWHVLEHVPDVKGQISELKRLLKHDGAIVIAVPNYQSYDAKYYGQFWAAFDVPRHLWHFSDTSIRKLFSEQGFKLERMSPMKFDAFYVSLLSEKYKSGKMNPVKALISGLKSNIKASKTTNYSSVIYILKNINY